MLFQIPLAFEDCFGELQLSGSRLPALDTQSGAVSPSLITCTTGGLKTLASLSGTWLQWEELGLPGHKWGALNEMRVLSR